jgi:hypothetical protein
MLTEEDRLHVRRHQVRYRVAKGTLRPPAFGAQHEALQTSLGERLSAGFPRGDKSVWLIRRLDVRVSVGASSTPLGIARAVAAAVTGALARTFEEGADGANVMRFPDRATFIGRLLSDCARGRAARRWEYGEFGEILDGPASIAVRSIAATEPGTALDALIRMAAGDLRVVLASLSSEDAGAVLESLRGAPGSSRGEPAHDVVEALKVLLARSELPSEPGPAAVALFLEVARSMGGQPAVGTDARAKEVARLAQALRTATPEESRKLAGALAEGDWQRVGAQALGELTELVSWPSAIRGEAVCCLSERLSGESAPDHPIDHMTTDLGGMFLLLPLIGEFPWTAATATWPHLGAADPSRLLQYLTLVAALGRDRSPAAAGDAVLRLALGLPAEVGVRSIYAWTRGVSEEAARRSAHLMTEHLHRLGKVSGEVTLAPLADGVVAVDSARGIWLGAAPADPESIRSLIASIDAALDRPAAVAASEPWIEACIDPGRIPPPPIDERFLIRLDESVHYATVGAPFELVPAVRDMVMIAAQTLGRELAWRLPGFSTSTLPYLWDNFLTFAAEISFEPRQIIVHVGDPPLHLVLSLAGLNRRRFHLDTTGEREWVLTQRR